MKLRLEEGPLMEPREIEVLHDLLVEQQPRRVLEWGSGGSTLTWPQMFPDIEWWTLEHNRAYYEALRERVPAHVKLVHLPFPDYHELSPRATGLFDLIIVDGRERVKCLSRARDLLVPGGSVLLHDASRPRYAPAWAYYRHAETLVGARDNPKDPRGLALFRDPYPSKVFGLGLSRTGTNSLNAALEALGYRALHYPPPQRVMVQAEEYDALTDTPVIPYMEALDARYPSALFVLTVRDIDEWLASCRAHWGQPKRDGVLERNRRAVFGIAEFDTHVFRHVYLAHTARVREHFAARPHKLLVFEISEGWASLCSALRYPIPDTPFPHLNRSTQ